MKVSKTHWKKLTNPNYLGSWDFMPGEERLLTIDKIVQDEVFNPTDNAKKQCMVMHFRENSKPMIINKTNSKTIAAIYNTPYIEDWSGHQIVVGVERVKAFGKLEDALRVRKTVPTLKCADCGQTINAFENFTASEIADRNFKRYGVNLCAACSNKRKGASANGVNA